MHSRAACASHDIDSMNTGNCTCTFLPCHWQTRIELQVAEAIKGTVTVTGKVLGSRRTLHCDDLTRLGYAAVVRYSEPGAS